MISKTLSKQAQNTVNGYVNLPIYGHNINCPYFNNRRANVRGGLRVMIGKGSVEDIAEEIVLMGLREKIDYNKLTDGDLKKFLVENGIGIDCSGFVYHVLDSELKARGLGGIKKHIKFAFIKTPWRKFLSWLRPAEHAGVRTISADENCDRISLENVLPGDMIVFIKTGVKHDRNHIMLITKVEYDDADVPQKIHYTHSFQWRTDGRYGHGVRIGKIQIIDATKNLSDQNWEENGKASIENETLEHAKLAEERFIARFRALIVV